MTTRRPISFFENHAKCAQPTKNFCALGPAGLPSTTDAKNKAAQGRKSLCHEICKMLILSLDATVFLQPRGLEYKTRLHG